MFKAELSEIGDDDCRKGKQGKALRKHLDLC